MDPRMEVYKKYFIELEPHMQELEVEKNKDDMIMLILLYPHAKDDMLRYKIIEHTGDTALARRLYNNTKYATVQKRLQKFIK